MNVKRIFDFAALALEKFPKEDCLVTKKNGKWIKTSTVEFINQGNKISRGLLKLGIKPGDKIGLISSNNRTEWAVMDLGISQIGVVTVPVYPTISPEDYVYIFNNSEIKYCFVSDSELYKKITKAKEFLAEIEKRFVKNDKAETSMLLQSLISMKYKGKGNIREYIMEMSQLLLTLRH